MVNKRTTRRSMDDALCCCEYFNMNGERSHVLAMFCDCEIVDSICDKILKRQEISEDKLDLLRETIEDRCRIPWFTGAIKVNPANLIPIFLLPFTILWASNGLYSTIFSFISFPFVLLFFYRIFNRKKRSKIFVSLAITSVAFSIFVFVVFVCSLRRLLLWEMLIFFAIFLIFVKQLFNLMIIRPEKPSIYDLFLKNAETPLVDTNSNKEKRLVDGNLNQEMQLVEKNKNDFCICEFCHKDHESERSGFCEICNKCIPLRDHHCVWIDKCVGEGNHKAFLICLISCVIASSFGLHLTLTSICTPAIYFDWFLVPSDCRYVYSDYMTSIPFVVAIYTAFLTASVFVILLHQIVLISQNVTTLEWARSRRGGGHTAGRMNQPVVVGLTVRCCLVAWGNPHDVGFLRNWKLFWGGRRLRGGDCCIGV